MTISQVTACLLLAGAAGVFSEQPRGPASAGDAREGAAVFETSCASCHNTDSDEEKEGPPLKGAANGRLPSGKKASREVILDKVNSGGGSMPSFKERLTGKEKEDVIAFVLTL